MADGLVLFFGTFGEYRAWRAGLTRSGRGRRRGTSARWDASSEDTWTIRRVCEPMHVDIEGLEERYDVIRVATAPGWNRNRAETPDQREAWGLVPKTGPNRWRPMANRDLTDRQPKRQRPGIGGAGGSLPRRR